MFKLAGWPGQTTRFAAAMALGIAGPALHTFAKIPLIPYAPFMVISAIALGLGPGLVTTLLCILEALYFARDAVSSWSMVVPADWELVSVIAFTGLFASLMADRLKKVSLRLKESNRKTNAILESISDGFVAFDRYWHCDYVNSAAARMMRKAPGELLGKNLWELWPRTMESPFGLGFRRAVAENIPVVVEAYYPEPLNTWFDVRSYPAPNGLTLFFTDTTVSRRKEEQLRFLETAALQTSDAIVIVNVSGDEGSGEVPVFVNSAFERITGFSIRDVEQGALGLLDGLPPVSSAPEDQDDDPRLSRTVYVERPARRKDGSEFWAEFAFTRLRDQNGSYTHWVWNLRDITERKRTEEASRVFMAIVEDSDDAIYSKNLDGIILTWNQGAERMHGYLAEEIVGQSEARLMPPDRAYEHPEILDGLRRGVRREHLETERLRKDGRRFQVSLTVSPIRDSTGSVVGASIISRDITERKVAEKALALSEERYRSLASASTQIVWATNPHGEVIEDIPMWCQFTGQDPGDVTGLGWIFALHPDDRDRTADVWLRAVRCRSFYDTEYRLRRHDGEYRWMAVHGVPVLEGDGNIREWVTTCVDIQDRKQAEDEIRKLNDELEQRVADRTAELQAANKELEAFAYSVSHDLRAPLRAIDGFSKIMLEEHGRQVPAEAQHYLETVRKNALQMGELIDDLLAFSRLGRQPLRKQAVAPAELVHQVLEDLRQDREGRQVEITVGDLPACQGDPQLLKQVLVNLLSNGLKYTRAREVAKIEIGAEPPSQGHAPVYYVRDNGIGFDMRYADKLFGVFQRLHGTREYPGTGVGLAIVQRIIHRHGGQVWAEAAVNQGATFYFALAAEVPRLAQEELETCPNNS